MSLRGCSPDPIHIGRKTVYVQLLCHTGFAPLHSVLGAGTFRTNDHVTWTQFLYQGLIFSKDTHPTVKVLLLAGLLRDLWETDPEVDIRNLEIYLPDQSLVKFFRSPTDSFTNKVAECLYTKSPICISSRPDEFTWLPRPLRFTSSCSLGRSWPWRLPLPARHRASLGPNFAPPSMGHSSGTSFSVGVFSPEFLPRSLGLVGAPSSSQSAHSKHQEGRS